MSESSIYPFEYVRASGIFEERVKVTFNSLDDVENEMEFLANDWDTQFGHVSADLLLCLVLRRHGYDELVRIFEGMKKWYA